MGSGSFAARGLTAPLAPFVAAVGAGESSVAGCAAEAVLAPLARAGTDSVAFSLVFLAAPFVASGVSFFVVIFVALVLLAVVLAMVFSFFPRVRCVAFIH